MAQDVYKIMTGGQSAEGGRILRVPRQVGDETGQLWTDSV